MNTNSMPPTTSHPAPTPMMSPCYFFLLLLIGLAVLQGAGTVVAAPFAEQISFTQPNGKQITLWGEGDEFYAVFETLDGYTVIYNPATKAYDYARLSADRSALESTGLAVGQGDPAALGLAKRLRISQDARKKQVRERFAKWDQGMEVTARWNQIKTAWQDASRDAKGGPVTAPANFITTGTKVGLTLLIDFSDAPATIPQAEVVAFCNADGYTGYGNNGSVKSYFSDNSNGMLTYTNIVTVYLRVPRPKSYYNDFALPFGDGANYLIRDAINVMKGLPNYATDILPALNALTVDGSGRVVACNVFFAGANSGVWAQGLWPHSWSLYVVGAQPLGNGMSVYKYQITNMGNALTLATFCHENGHMLCGYPDIYDYDYDSTGGSGDYCLMGSPGNAKNPAQFCAYLKRTSGWATTVDIDAFSSLEASVSASGADFNKFYRYQKPVVPTEYYLIENRQKSGRDSSLPGGGVLVWHIDELGDHNNQKTNYNVSHFNYEVSLIQADNLWHLQKGANDGDANDPYYLGNTATTYTNGFTDTTAPSARWWDGSLSKMKLFNFSAKGNTMTFTVGQSVPALQVTPSNGLSASGGVGGPFIPNSQVYTLKNTTPSNLTWMATNSRPWVTVAPMDGTLASNETVNVLVSINANANGLPLGDYSDTVTITNLTSASGSTTRPVDLTITPPRLHFFSLENDPGWTRQGQWAFGVPTGQGGASYGNPDPVSGATGTNVFGVNLQGDYNTTLGVPLYLTTGPLNFGGATNIVLQFKRRLNSDYQPYAHATIEISTNRTTWTQIWSNGRSAIAEAAWTTQTYSLPSWVWNQCAVSIRWGYQVGIEAHPYSGWNIDDVTILGEATGATPPTLTTSSPLPSGIVNSSYNTTLVASNGASPYFWSCSGTMAPGLGLNEMTGEISGSPTSSGTYNFTVRVTGSDGLFTEKEFSLTILAPPAITTSAALPNGKTGSSYCMTLTASGGTKPYTWSYTGSMVPGLRLGATTGVISGTPTASGTYTFTIRCTGNDGLYSEKEVSITIYARVSGPLASFSPGDVPQPITDFITNRSTLVVSGISGNVADVNVTLGIQHTYDADLVVTLISPQGTRVRLFGSVGGDGQNFMETIFDDEAATDIRAGQAPFIGAYRPQTPLSVLDGQDPNGTWALEIYDQAGADSGMLQSWSLTIAGGGAIWQAEEMACGADGKLRVAWSKADGAMALWTLGSNAVYESSSTYGPFAGWTARALRVSRYNSSICVAWEGDANAVSVWNLGSSGVLQSAQTYGPYPGWSYKDLIISPYNGDRFLIWEHIDGAIAIWRLSSTGAVLNTVTYGPYDTWMLWQVDISPVDGKLWLLWLDTADRKVALWRLSTTGGYEGSISFGPYPGWEPWDLRIGRSDGKPRLLWVNASGLASIWRLSSTFTLEGTANFGPYADWNPMGILSRADGKLILGWEKLDGQVSLWRLSATEAFENSVTHGPFSGWEMWNADVDAASKLHALWRHGNGEISLWRLSPTFTLEGTANYGPY